MQITDTIADMLTRIRNASSARHETVDIPASNMKSCFLYCQPLACSVFYRTFPAQRLFDPRMVVPVDVFTGEVDDLLAGAFLPMPGDARTRAFIRPKNPSAAALSGLHPFAPVDRTRPYRPIRSSHPGHR